MKAIGVSIILVLAWTISGYLMYFDSLFTFFIDTFAIFRLFADMFALSGIFMFSAFWAKPKNMYLFIISSFTLLLVDTFCSIIISQEKTDMTGEVITVFSSHGSYLLSTLTLLTLSFWGIDQPNKLDKLRSMSITRIVLDVIFVLICATISFGIYRYLIQDFDVMNYVF